jgi:hypothetical protein
MEQLNQSQPSQSPKTLQELVQSGSKDELLALFNFSHEDSNQKVVLKFNLWARKLFPKYFTSRDAEFHKQIDLYNVQAYRGQIKTFTDVAFRGSAKTTRTKLFLAFAILNDTEHSRKYLKILAEDGKNSTQSVTDIYNMLVYPSVVAIYDDTFAKSVYKREETMSSFTTSFGVKLTADTVGTAQRGDLQEEGRPDIIWFDDFETRKTLRSAVTTKAIWDNMEEAKNGLAINGAAIYTANYISERGNVHKLMEKGSSQNIVINIPIRYKNGEPSWPDRYSKEYISQLEKDAEDFAGEYQGEPSAGADVLFDRETLDKQEERQPIEERAGLKIFYKYDPSSRYGSGHDVAGGVGLDSSTSVFIDFDTIPARVVATFKNNTIKPDIFGDEIKRQADMFGTCLVAPEQNNHGVATIARLKQIYPKGQLHKTQRKDTKVDNQEATEYGWHTNGATKPKMMFALAKAIEKGLLTLSDKDLIAEAKAYTRDDLLDSEIDPRLTTRHFDLLIAAAIAWQMKDFAQVKKVDDFQQPEEDMVHPDIGA